MGIFYEQEIKNSTLKNIAERMLVAARTAPKGKGLNTLESIIIDGEDLLPIADKMKEIGNRPYTTPAFIRDAENLLNAETLVLFGTRIETLGLAYCGLCGFENCTEKQKHPQTPCAFNTGDLGIAIGSAISIATDARVDNRIMYTVGMAVKELGIMSDAVKIIYGIPLSSSSKNIFFDRK